MIPVAERLGDVVIEAENLAKGYGDRLLYENVNFKLPPGGIVGVIGPNGAGKTTLFRMLTGQEKPDAGTLKVGSTVQMGYVDQSRDALDPNKTVYEEISGGTDIIEFGKTKINARAYCRRISPSRAATSRRRSASYPAASATACIWPRCCGRAPICCCWTNRPTIWTWTRLRALESALEEFAGCAMIISHDRWFLDRIATHMLAFEGDSHVEWFEGNYQDYEADKKRRLGMDADQPHRIKYKRFARGLSARSLRREFVAQIAMSYASRVRASSCSATKCSRYVRTQSKRYCCAGLPRLTARSLKCATRLRTLPLFWPRKATNWSRCSSDSQMP